MGKKYQHILVAIDGSKQAEEAMDAAIEMAVEQGSHLYIAWVIDEGSLSTSAYAFSKVLADEQTFVVESMEQRVEKAKTAGVNEVTSLVEVTNPKRYLAHTIPEKYPIDLIVIGATGKGRIQQAMLGSTTGYVVTHARCNVLVVKE
jgi:nucleotide-binding universal stress UspA family protein